MWSGAGQSSKFSGPGQPFFPGSGRGGACIPAGYHSADLSPFPWCSRRQPQMMRTTIIKISIRMMTTLVVLVLILTIIIVIAIIIITCRAKIWLCAVTGILESCSNFAAK